MSRRVMMIAYHYPPMRGSSGLLRTLKFSRYLTEMDWDPTILTVHPRAYPARGDDLLGEIPSQVRVVRAFALDSARHLSVAGRFPRWLALPDRWVSWCLGAIPAGLNVIRRERPALLWSTYPIATAHVIGFALHRLTGIPWVADFRDPMSEDDYPPHPGTRALYRRIETRVLRHAARSVFTTAGTCRLYAERYPELPASRLVVIANGYDEENFAAAETYPAAPARPARITLVHSGILYPSERDPVPFFNAVRALAASGVLHPERVRIVLRATGHDQRYRPMLRELGIEHLVELQPAVNYVDALAEMLHADGLLLFQAANCNLQVPAKAYEYLRARRPMLALTDPAGDTGQLLRSWGVEHIAALDNRPAIQSALADFIHRLERNAAPHPHAKAVAQYSRRAQTRLLADLFREVLL